MHCRLLNGWKGGCKDPDCDYTTNKEIWNISQYLILKEANVAKRSLMERDVYCRQVFNFQYVNLMEDFLETGINIDCAPRLYQASESLVASIAEIIYLLSH